MKKKNYIHPSLRYIHISPYTLLAASSNRVSIDHEEGVWEADANKESQFNSIWDDGDPFSEK